MTAAAPVALRGITWDHPRAYEPLVAATREFASVHGPVTVEWLTRSLFEFGEGDVRSLTDAFDLLIIDHPSSGLMAASHCCLALDEYVGAKDLQALSEEYVGPSFASYLFNGRQWALPIDAACHVTVSRPDLLARVGVGLLPTTWPEVVELAEYLAGRTDGRLVMPWSPTDVLMSLYSIRHAVLERSGDDVAAWTASLELLGRVATLADPSEDERRTSPINVLDRMSMTDDVAYCPVLFGYSNYSRTGTRPNLVTFSNAPGRDVRHHGSILGGAGIAVSATTAFPLIAVELCRFLTSPEVQAGTYVSTGGQPAHRAAWTDDRANELTNGFFLNTLDTIEGSYLRPRHLGYVEAQNECGRLVHEWLFGGIRRDAAELAMVLGSTLFPTPTPEAAPDLLG
jgi:multiple sugar transport system substrate-binding protein